MVGTFYREEKNGTIYTYKDNNYIGMEDLSSGVEYLGSGKLKYKGGYLNGKRSGTGKYYYPNGNIMYEGEFRNGVCDGEGIYYYEDMQEKYVVNYINNMQHGYGTLYYDNSNVKYKGEWLNGIENGQAMKAAIKSIKAAGQMGLKMGKVRAIMKMERYSMKGDFLTINSTGKVHGTMKKA